MKKKIPADHLNNSKSTNFENSSIHGNFPTFNAIKNKFSSFLSNSKADSLYDQFQDFGITKPLGQTNYAHSDLGNSIHRIHDSFLDQSFSADRYQKVMKLIEKINLKVTKHDEWISMNQNKFNRDLQLSSCIKNEVQKQVKQQIKLAQGIKLQSQNFKRQLQKINIKDQTEKILKTIKQQTDNEIAKIFQKINELKIDFQSYKNVQNKNTEKNQVTNHQGLSQNVLNELRTKLSNLQKIFAISRPLTLQNYKYLGKAHMLKYNEYITVINQKKIQTVSIFQSEYKVDNQGYLLDMQQNYLIDCNNRMIKLDQQHLTILKKNHMLL